MAALLSPLRRVRVARPFAIGVNHAVVRDAAHRNHMDIESKTSANTIAPSKSDAPLRGHFQAGYRPAVRVIAPGWDTDATTAFSDLFELVSINSLTAYVRNPCFVGELAFDADEVVIVDLEAWLAPLTGVRSPTRPLTDSGSESAVWAPRSRRQLIAAGLLSETPRR